MSLALPTTHRTFDASQTIRRSPASEFSQDDEQALFSRDELRQFARRRAFATPKCAAGVAQLAGDRILADENTKLPAAW